MNEKLYELMDWAGIEALVYSEEDQPFKLLGAHVLPEGILIQTFRPGAEKISVVCSDGSGSFDMTLEDETGFFAVLLEGQEIPAYTYHVVYTDGRTEDIPDAYRILPQVIDEKDEAKFQAGIWYDSYEKLGAHCMEIEGVSGVYFAVWAPNAVRVSVVGDFTGWDGRLLPMRRREASGIFELFVPGLNAGDLYKFEIKARGGLTYLKADPYANAAQLRPETASVIAQPGAFAWTDATWMREQAQKKWQNEPISVYEVHLGSWRRPEDGRLFYNYRELAHMLGDYVQKAGFTHIELLPVMEHPLDESWGYQTGSYFAPTARYGSPKDFKYFVNYLHSRGIGVILDWAPAHFPPDTFCLCGFDGTCLYEHQDPRQGRDNRLGTLLYNYGRPEVRNFLISAGLFWAREYHADGLRMDAVSSMLYLDYGKSDGQWVANMYGGNENLEAIEFLKHINSVMRKRHPGVMLIAREDGSWPKVTAPVEEDGLGFDFKWNESWTEDFLTYMQLDPVFRGYHHGDLTLSMIYQYCENYILPFDHNEVVYGKGSMPVKMPGRKTQKLDNLRAAYGYQAVHPGKKLLFMGLEFGQRSEWNVSEELSWELLEDEEHASLREYVNALQQFYRAHPALWQLDSEPEGFEWINDISANENLLIFLRKGQKPEDTLLVICNFSPLVYENHKVGVPFAGKYKEIFSSDKAAFGGQGNLNPRLKNAKLDECDGRGYSIRVLVPPMGISIFSCTREVQTESGNEKAKQSRSARASARRHVPSGKTAGKKPESGETLKEELDRKIQEARAEEESRWEGKQ